MSMQRALVLLECLLRKNCIDLDREGDQLLASLQKLHDESTDPVKVKARKVSQFHLSESPFCWPLHISIDTDILLHVSLLLSKMAATTETEPPSGRSPQMILSCLVGVLWHSI